MTKTFSLRATLALGGVAHFYLVRPMKPFLAIAIIVATVSGCHRAANLRGSVFIVTRGGDNVKLGLVEVRAIPLKAAVEHLEKKREEFMAAGPGGWRTEESVEQDSATSQDLARHIFESLPHTDSKTLTDADGRFVIPAIAGKSYYLAAKGSREVGSTKEEYHWFCPSRSY